MLANSFFDKVYLRTMIPAPDQNLEFETILKLVARYACYGPDGRALFEDGRLCPKRTKRLIIKHTDAFIVEFRQVCSEEDLATCTSFRQINKMAKSFCSKKKCIPCYSVVILYIMCRICIDKGAKANDIKPFYPFVDYFNKVVGAYYAENPDDIVAHFLWECLTVIKDGIEAQKSVLDFPPIPRTSPQSTNLT